jgi:hypothetical protein
MSRPFRCISVGPCYRCFCSAVNGEAGWATPSTTFRRAYSVRTEGNSHCRHPPNHLAYPLLAYGTIPWYDYLFGIFALQIICTWLYNGAGASVLIAMIAHLFSNLLTATVKPLFSTADQERYWLIMVAVECLTALGILIATQGRLGLQPTNERAPNVQRQ